MRTDAKIGFAIVGVLVAVLAVYGFVVSKHARRPAGDTATNIPVKVVPDTVPPHSADPTVVVPPDPAAPGRTNPPPATPSRTTPETGDGTAVPPGGNSPGSGHPGLMPEPPIDPIPPSGSGSAVPPRDGGGRRHPTPADPTATDRPSTPTVALATHTYRVRSGQTLSSIAAEVYGDSRLWRQIVKQNPGLNPSKLKVGTQIQIPDPNAVRPHPAVVIPAADLVVTGEPSVAAVVAGASYRVRPGDTLYAIAKRYLGSGRDAARLYQMNRSVIGPNMRLKPGITLQLPSTTDVMLSDAAG